MFESQVFSNLHTWALIMHRYIHLPCVHIQVYASLVLLVMIALYGFVQPYRSKVANILELVFQTNFFVFILLENTPLIRDNLFTFPVEDPTTTSVDESYESSISNLTWLLTPFYYLPLIVFVLVCAAYGGHYIWWVWLYTHCHTTHATPQWL